MKISILAIGKCDPLLARALEHYETSAKHYWQIQVQEITGGVSGWKGVPPDEVRKKESERIMAKLPDRAEVIALSRAGKEMSSVGLSEYFQRCAVGSVSNIAFVIGGAFGLGKVVLRRADRVMALSSFTVTHGFARLILMEQIYRAGTIMRNEPYHKGNL